MRVKKPLVVANALAMFFATAEMSAHASEQQAPQISPVLSKSWLDFQTIWQLGPAILPDKNLFVDPKDPIYSIPLLPKRLFRSDGFLKISDNVELYQGNMQFALMESEKLVACSLSRGAVGTLSEKNRVCLIDVDNDGKFDNYFLRAFRSYIYVGKEQRIAFAGKFESDIQPLPSNNVTEIPPNRFESPEYIKVYYSNYSDKKGGIVIFNHAENVLSQGTPCGSHVLEGAAPSQVSCGTAGAVLRATGRQGKKFSFEILPNGDSELKFIYSVQAFHYRANGFTIIRNQT